MTGRAHVPGRVKFLVCVDRRPQSRVAVHYACRRGEAEELLRVLAAEVNEWAGIVPGLVVRDGDIGEQILAQVEEDASIDVLVVGAAPPTDKSFSLITFLAGKLVGRLSIPLVIVPGNLTDERIADMT